MGVVAADRFAPAPGVSAAPCLAAAAHAVATGGRPAGPMVACAGRSPDLRQGRVMTQESRTAVLVHNIGHHDAYAFLAEGDGGAVLHRVEGIGSKSFGKEIWSHLESGSQVLEPGAGAAVRLEPAVGLSWAAHKVRARFVDGQRHPCGLSKPRVTGLFFPLVDAAVEALLGVPGHAALHVVLVSSGPRGNSQGAGKSTEAIARVMARHLGERFPAVEVHHVHRDREQPFSADGTADDLRKVDAHIRAVRRGVVAVHGEGWRDHFSVYLSANTGTVSIISAMLEGVRPHRPSLVHIRDAYRWPERDGVPVLPEVRLLDHDHYAQRPARPAKHVDDEVAQFAVEQMRAWMKEYTRQRPVRAGERPPAGKERNAEDAFWFRKGQKEVLAVLVVRDRETGALQAHRAVNLEVSLPTGTLCAERNAIGTAFAARPTLRRGDIEAVAVLSLDKGLKPRLGPCGACTEWLRKVAEINPDFRVVTFNDLECTQVFVDPVDG
ncbi:MAG: hypothetical protein EA398_10975 [Deltaproteobacteria bacterium]|nr:MAG: hypothetical protein EA398_10975 [Deltaproteobacteria bacterium]